MLYANNINFKQANRNLQKELQEFGLKLSNSATLNLLSRVLGYKNYNTYKPIFEENEEILSQTTTTLKEVEKRIDEALKMAIKKNKKSKETKMGNNILNLDVNIKGDVNTTLKAISSELGNGWTRDAKAEESIKEMGSTQFAFNYNDGKQNNTIFLIERNNKLETTNVVPQSGTSSIPISECNSMLTKFEEDVLNNTDLKYSIHS